MRRSRITLPKDVKTVTYLDEPERKAMVEKSN